MNENDSQSSFSELAIPSKKLGFTYDSAQNFALFDTNRGPMKLNENTILETMKEDLPQE